MENRIYCSFVLQEYFRLSWAHRFGKGEEAVFFTSLTEWTPGNLLLRMVVSFVLGALIGIDRGAKKRGGGARTDAAVCLGSALVMMTAQYVGITFPGKTDITRLAAQVVSGVGFLGAGSIIVSGHQVKGLTSAASIWICACIGIATGIGFVDGAVILTLILLVGLHLLPLIEERVYYYSRYIRLYVEVRESGTVAMLLHQLKIDGCKVDMYDIERPGTQGQSFTALITVHIPWRFSKEEYLKSLGELDGILFVDTM